jgi:hypothetical protein
MQEASCKDLSPAETARFSGDPVPASSTILADAFVITAFRVSASTNGVHENPIGTATLPVIQ